MLGRRWPPDMVALALLAAMAIAATFWIGADVARFISGDWPTQYLPWYAFLGERLRAGDIPGWNPHQFSGAPFVADPNSGWAYLPTMRFYTLLPAESATAALTGFHLLLAGWGAYLLARVLRLAPPGAFIAGLTMMVPWTLLAARQLPYVVSVTSWIPLALLGGELAVREVHRGWRFGGVVLAGLAISQLLGIWLGKGAYYGMMPLAAWLVYRTLLVPARPAPLPRRVVDLLGCGVAILAIGGGLGAAGLLPRLAANARSNIPGGIYDRSIAILQPDEAWSPLETILRLGGGFNQGRLLVGAAVLGLAVLAPFLARRWFAAPYFVLLGLTALVLTGGETTPLHALLFALLPGFARIHLHDPAGIAMLIPLPAAMLAGAAVSAMIQARDRNRELAAVVAGGGLIASIVAVLAATGDATRTSLPLLVLAAAIAAVTLGVILPHPWRVLLVPALAIVILWQPTAELRERELGDRPARWGTLYRALGARGDRFLHDNTTAQAILAAPGGPHRYIGYEPGFLPPPESGVNAYRNVAHEPGAAWLLLDNWATWFGLDSAQGYNAVQVKRYVEFITAMNGHRQEYHGSNVFPSGLSSSLFDLLNIRYITVPADAPERDGLRDLVATLPTVYDYNRGRILENTGALPRAWLVHEARQVAAGEALSLLATGAVDPRQTALLESAPPDLAAPADPRGESVRWETADPDRLVLRVTANAPALVMLSEVWDPGWTAKVDGAPIEVLLANHVLRAAAIPTGAHTLELRYDPPLLRSGIAITLLTVATLVLAGIVLRRPVAWRRSVAFSGGTPPGVNAGSRFQRFHRQEMTGAAMTGTTSDNRHRNETRA